MILAKYKKILYLGFLILFVMTVPLSAGIDFQNIEDYDSKAKALGGFPTVANLADLARKAAEASDKGELLDPPTDKNAHKNYNPPGMPTMPISCGNSDKSGCEECYREAHENLRKLRLYFEQLRTLYTVTDDFTKAEIAFGDGIAGSVGVGALAWNVERTEIQKSFKDFKRAYNKKYNELLERLKKTLEQIATCEAKYFGNEDWYSRYGFMFVTFISMYYAR